MSPRRSSGSTTRSRKAGATADTSGDGAQAAAAPTVPGPGPLPRVRLRDAISEPGGFITVVEIVPARGTLDEPASRRSLETALEMARNPRITALSITDNAGGHAMLGPEPVAALVTAEGCDAIVHVACRDRSRNELLGVGWRLVTRGLGNVLAVTGDYPVEGYRGLSRPVFDLDSVGLLQMYRQLNRELAGDGEDGQPAQGPGPGTAVPTGGLFLGAAVSSHKRLESELVPQYLKLMTKLRAGANFVINQVGYNARKDDELLRYLALRGVRVPVLANVYVLSGGAARAFNSGKIPGVVLTDELMAIVEREAASPDKGRAFFLEMASRQVAIARGLGFAGAYLGGRIGSADVERILDMAAGYGPDDWRSFVPDLTFGQPGEFYLFEKERDGGLNTNTLSRRYRAARTPRARSRARLRAPITYRVNQIVHDAVFEPGTPIFRLGAAFYRRAEQLHLMGPLHAVEHAIKAPTYGCEDCGDCSLPDLAYLCPEARCAKHLRNGPCGGSRDGECEVPGAPCVWTRTYERLRADGNEERMLERPVVYVDNQLRGSSAWANTFLERDHFSRRDERPQLPGRPRS
jgi:methylenetetrahydrofolate reductase (NADPH)